MSLKYISYIKNKKGFTLIELLTVIAIIAILTGLFTVSYLSVRQRARDAQRKSDIKQLQSALELFRADNDTYPDTAAFQALGCGVAFTNAIVTPAPATTVTYMNKIPCDPGSTPNMPYYYAQISATSYVVGACLENTNDKDAVAGNLAAPSWWTSPPAVWPPPTDNCTSVNYFYVSSNP